MRYDGGSNCDYERNDDDEVCVQNAGLTHADLRLPKKRVVFHTHITPSQTNDDEDADDDDDRDKDNLYLYSAPILHHPKPMMMRMMVTKRFPS